MRTVKEVSKLTGVSVRTLHHYDAIGLLKPTRVTEAGYRLYDDAALSRLQQILLFRELQFPLKEIKAMLDNPRFDPSEAIRQQLKLLELQYRHIGALIAFAREIQEKGVTTMSFTVFDKGDINAYQAEVKAKWGNTPAYREYEQRASAQKEKKMDQTSDFLALFAAIGALKVKDPADATVQEKITALQTFITEHYYTCTPEILHGLGDLYTQDARFRETIDRAGGTGTAEFVRRAIAVHCSG